MLFSDLQAMNPALTMCEVAYQCLSHAIYKRSKAHFRDITVQVFGLNSKWSLRFHLMESKEPLWSLRFHLSRLRSGID